MKNELEGWSAKDIDIGKVIGKILNDTEQWEFSNNSGCAWYRGQDCTAGPKPSVFRKEYDEFHLTTTFRNRAKALKDTPETNRIDQWLFLMQHYRTPTRLLDWTESPLLGLYFALNDYLQKDIVYRTKNDPSLWAIHPFELNKLSISRNDFPNTWTRKDFYLDHKKRHKDVRITKKVFYELGKRVMNSNPGVEYFRLAFHPRKQWDSVINLKIVKYPIAIHSQFLDMRIFAQRSSFTIHGIVEDDFETIFDQTSLVRGRYFLKYIIPGDNSEKLLKDLKRLGINESSIFPDLEGLSLELKDRFLI